MKYLVFAVLLGCSIVFTAGQAPQNPGGVLLPNCTDGFLDIHENQNNTILCETTNPQATIVWSIQRSGQPRTAVATCDPFNCTVHQPDHFALQRLSSHSLLFYQQYDRSLDTAANIICESQLDGNQRTQSCKLNVINPATLSNCVVEIFRAVTGSCRFHKASSFSQPFACTWLIKHNDELTIGVFGNITTTSMEGHLESGVCSFTERIPLGDPASFTYSILFYPGPRETTVDNITTNTEATGSTIRKTQETTTLKTASSTQGGTEPPSSSVLNNSTLQAGNEERSPPVAAIVGGCVGAVVVMVVAVVIVVIVVKRRDATYANPRRRQTPEHVYDGLHTTTTTTTANTTSASPDTPISDQHSLALDDAQKQEVKPNHAHHNPVYVNEEQRQPQNVTGAMYYNQVTQGYTDVTQNPTYVNDSGKAAHEYSNGDRDSNPYYSEIKE